MNECFCAIGWKSIHKKKKQLLLQLINIIENEWNNNKEVKPPSKSLTDNVIVVLFIFYICHLVFCVSQHPFHIAQRFFPSIFFFCAEFQILFVHCNEMRYNVCVRFVHLHSISEKKRRKNFVLSSRFSWQSYKCSTMKHLKKIFFIEQSTLKTVLSYEMIWMEWNEKKMRKMKSYWWKYCSPLETSHLILLHNNRYTV